MAIIQDATLSNLARVSSKGAQFMSYEHRGNVFVASSVTGTIAAALGANSSVFAMRLDPSAGNINAYIKRIRCIWTTIVAFTTPVTAGRRLAIYRGSGAAASGGTAIAAATKLDSLSAASEFDSAQGGDIRIASTGALTVTGITFETTELATMPLTHVGAAGNYHDYIFEFGENNSAPIHVQAGQVIAIRNPVAMDAAGTWQLAVQVEWFEEDSTTL